MVERIAVKLKNTSGQVSIVWTPVLIILIFMCIAVAGEFIRIQNIFSLVQETADTAVVSACTAQTPDVYNGAIESSAVSRYPEGDSGWGEKITTDIVLETMCHTLNLQEKSDGYYSIINNQEMYHIIDVDVDFDNMEGDVLHFQTDVKISVPIYFGNELLPPLVHNLIIKSSYMLKF